MMQRTRSWAAVAALLATVGAAQAALVKNGDGTITDTSTDLIWLQDWSVTGRQTWATQEAWAENLRFAGSSDWALPSIDDDIDLDFEPGGAIVAGGFAPRRCGHSRSAAADAGARTVGVGCGGVDR